MWAVFTHVSYDNNQNSWTDTQPKTWKQGATMCMCTMRRRGLCIRITCKTNYYMYGEGGKVPKQSGFAPGPIVNK